MLTLRFSTAPSGLRETGGLCMSIGERHATPPPTMDLVLDELSPCRRDDRPPTELKMTGSTRLRGSAFGITTLIRRLLLTTSYDEVP